MSKIFKFLFPIMLAVVSLPAYFLGENHQQSYSVQKNRTGHAVSAAHENDENNLADVNACGGFSKDNSVTKSFRYVLNGDESEVVATFYPELAKCLEKLDKDSSCPKCKHAKAEDQDDKFMIDNVVQRESLKELADNIQKITSDKNDQARIAISVVQGLKYEDNDPNDYDYPYNTAFDQKGICNETSKLLVIMLRELGFGTAMFTFEKDNHQAIGIKCDPQYSYQNSGYCFIETTSRAIVTDNVDESNKVRVNPISDGLTFDASNDAGDANNFLSLIDKKNLGSEEQLTLNNLKSKYGLNDEKDRNIAKN